ncbi:MAG: NAD(P)H-hydrate dehydratase [Clostridia bacterium]|nr:NAD(P)H-hydrate dehydratase [Clostridia bacterium]
MTEVYSAALMKESDAYTIDHNIPARELMFRAGKRIYEKIDRKGPVAVVCGSGNNAGDGFVIASLFHGAGEDVTIFLLSDKTSEIGGSFLNECRENGVRIVPFDEKTDLSGFSVVVDAVFGIGFRGEARGIAREAIRAINESGAYVVSVDINSGLDADSGIADLCVVSDLTVSVGGFKTGHFLNMAKDVMKEKINCDIGIKPVGRTYRLFGEEELRRVFKKRPNFSHKGTYGYVALIGGSTKYPGAIRLAHMANAAMRSGAGVAKTAFPASLYHEIAPSVLESTVFPLSDLDGQIVFSEKEIKELTSGVKTVAIGMGIGTGDGAQQTLEYLLNCFEGTLIVDADGLNILSATDASVLKDSKPRLVLTPHVKEFSRLTGASVDELIKEPVKRAEEYALATDTVVLLKGPSTVVTDGEETYIVDAGCPGMATAGSGDVLSGIASAVCSYTEDLTLAAAAAAYVNGKAGEAAQRKNGSVSMIASDTVASIPEIISRYE